MSVNVLIGAAGTILKLFMKCLNDLSLGTREKSGTGHCKPTSKILVSKCKMGVIGSKITYTINCNHRIVVTLYTTEICFVPGI